MQRQRAIELTLPGIGLVAIVFVLAIALAGNRHHRAVGLDQTDGIVFAVAHHIIAGAELVDIIGAVVGGNRCRAIFEWVLLHAAAEVGDIAQIGNVPDHRIAGIRNLERAIVFNVDTGGREKHGI